MKLHRHPSRVQLMMLHDGELTTEEAETVSTHAERCARCTAWLEKLDHVGAVVRGEVVPTPVPSPGRSWVPVAARLAPALAAVIVIVLGVVLVRDDDAARRDVIAGAGSVEDVSLPTAVPPAPPGGDSRPGGDNSGVGEAPDPTVPSDGTTLDPGTAAGESPAAATITVGVAVPGGLTGPHEPVARAVATALAAANDDADAGDVRFELAVVDSADPDAVEGVVNRGISVMVGGFADDSDFPRRLAAVGVPWLAPADVPAPDAPAIASIEIPHADAGKRVAAELDRLGHQRSVAVTDADSDERRLADGIGSSFQTAGATKPGNGCRSGLEVAAVSGADVLTLALPPSMVRTCLAALPSNYPIRQIVVPSTAVDEAFDAAPEGFGVLAALGAPLPDAAGSGPARFREVTGLSSGYRALVSFAAAELVADLVDLDADDPVAAFRESGVYRSDLLTLDPSSHPVNVAVQVTQLAEPTAIEAPSGDHQFGEPQGF